MITITRAGGKLLSGVDCWTLQPEFLTSVNEVSHLLTLMERARSPLKKLENLLGAVTTLSSSVSCRRLVLVMCPHRFCAFATRQCRRRHYVFQGSHASWKVLESPEFLFVRFLRPGKSRKMGLVLKSPGKFSKRSWKVLEFSRP